MNKKYFMAFPALTTQTASIAGIRWEPEPEPNDGEGLPDWLIFLILIGFVLAIFKK